MPTGGSTIRAACGTITCCSKAARERPIAAPASHLALVDRENPGTVNFGQICTVVYRQTDNAGSEGLKSDAILRQSVVDNEQLDQQRRAANDLNIGPAQRPQQRAARQAHQRECQSGDEGKRHGQNRQLDGGHRADEEIGEDLRDEVHRSSHHVSTDPTA